MDGRDGQKEYIVMQLYTVTKEIIIRADSPESALNLDGEIVDERDVNCEWTDTPQQDVKENE